MPNTIETSALPAPYLPAKMADRRLPTAALHLHQLPRATERPTTLDNRKIGLYTPLDLHTVFPTSKKIELQPKNIEYSQLDGKINHSDFKSLNPDESKLPSIQNDIPPQTNVHELIFKHLKLGYFLALNHEPDTNQVPTHNASFSIRPVEAEDLHLSATKKKEYLKEHALSSTRGEGTRKKYILWSLRECGHGGRHFVLHWFFKWRD